MGAVFVYTTSFISSHVVAKGLLCLRSIYSDLYYLKGLLGNFQTNGIRN
jgi:hypothetical protein